MSILSPDNDYSIGVIHQSDNLLCRQAIYTYLHVGGSLYKCQHSLRNNLIFTVLTVIIFLFH